MLILIQYLFIGELKSASVTILVFPTIQHNCLQTESLRSFEEVWRVYGREERRSGVCKEGRRGQVCVWESRCKFYAIHFSNLGSFYDV